MKKIITPILIVVFIMSVIFSSCGPSKELLESDAKLARLQKENANTTNLLDICNVDVAKLKGEKRALEIDNAFFQNDLKVLTAESNLTIADQAKRLKNLQGMIQAQKDVMNKLKNSITDALLNYKADELNVYIKNGSVYVSLEEKLLFKSGSDVVDPKGKEALKTLAKVLNTTTDINVMIEGHTDNVPIKTKEFKDNWDLSTARATSIVRILTDSYKFDSNRITASGRGDLHPVKSNITAEGRSLNRRTEVILSPDLKDLYKLLN